MKKSVKSLLTLLLLLGVTLEMKAADVYLLTDQTINGTVGKYAVPSNHKLKNTSGSNVYSLQITSMPEGGFWFRIGVSGWSNQMQPTVNDAPLTINEEGTQNPTSYSIDSDCYGSSNAWKVSYTAGEYEYLTVNVDITEGSTRRVWIEGKKKTSAGGSDEPVAQSTDVEPGYYLVGNFFSEHNVGGDVNPGGDGAEIDYTKHVYFKFEQQKDNIYAFSIPACLTAHAQILAVDDYGNKMVYGPGRKFGLHGAKNVTALPATNGTVGTMGETPTADCSLLVGSATLAEGNNYWDLETRNDGAIDDDGMYTFSFTLDSEGKPSGWQVKHDAKTRVSYILGDMEGATAQPLFDKRVSGGDTGRYSDNNVASLYFNGRNKYWCIGYVVNNVNSDNAKEQYDQAIKATPDIHVTASVNVNHDDNSGTHDKLFFLGNGGYPYNTSDKRNKVRPNQKPFTLNLYGIKRVQFNANKGDNDLAKLDDSYGMSAEIELKGDNNKADFSITTMSMIGDAVGGTYDAKTGKWDYNSKAGDMEYDANERCFSLTISTEEEKYTTPHYFRFVANHDAAQNWGETEVNVTNKTGLARHRYDGADDDNHSCMAGDPNDVQHRTTARGETEADSEIRTDILWNRPAGIWRIKFYPGLDMGGNDVSYYTITGTKVVKMPFTYRVRRFIRTYSNSVAMEPAKDNVKVYAAYMYEPPTEVKDLYSQGTVYLRELQYVPANMGVVLVGEVPEGEVPAGGYKDGAKVDFYLKEKTDGFADKYEDLWIKAAQYTNDTWNNYLKPTVSAIDKLGNADTDDKGTILHRYFGLGNFHSTKYYKETKTGDDYIGFFRFTENGKSGANKAYLSIPANKTVDGGVGATYGYIDYNGQLLGNVADTNNNQSLAKMAVIFDDEDNGGTTTAVSEVKMDTADADASFYTLQGVKVSRPVKGVYIHNGKKFIK
ncbi:MAG: hypothetical protein SO214_06885 [Prevotella pectinovora]|uniref:hypothetical protein n=1 Tax=Prevotella pectinovora TaxID=1602169 RepID=UPI002A7F0A51|nr:hypothetical protein [Prevotella pectinovora]MDY4779155.1 hypothetical protein [Prevotella pectinovora]